MKTARRKSSHAKRYRADPSSIYKLMNKLQPFTADEQMKLALPIRMAFEAIKTGRNTERTAGSGFGLAGQATTRAKATSLFLVAAHDAAFLHQYMRYIINDNQQRILETLNLRGEVPRSYLRMLAKISAKVFAADVPDILQDGLIAVRTPRENLSHRLYSITEIGKQALQDHIDHKTKKVLMMAEPNRRNLFEFPVYVPPKHGFVRNLGNGHIKSRGACV
jgi:DNA-binding MarR family transcriptional regulator